MTQRLYYDDAYLTGFDAVVVAARPDGGCAFTLVLPLEEGLEEEERT